MTLTIGIVGLPNVGKSTLFNALTKNDVLAANYPFATIEPNVGVVGVPDPRLAALAEHLRLGQAAAGDGVVRRHRRHRARARREGEGLGNKFLANIRESDAICQVIRAFRDPDVVHVDGEVAPKSDIETINTELILADLQTIEKALPRLEKEARLAKDKSRDDRRGRRRRRSCSRAAPRCTPVQRRAGIDLDDLRELHLMTAKPFLYVFNVDEDELGDEAFKDEMRGAGRAGRGDLPRRQDRGRARRAARRRGARAAAVARRRRSPASTSSRTSASGRSACRPTSRPGPKESRAWTIPVGATAPQAAGVIHTDFQRGFIKAEVVSFDELVDAGSMAEAKSRGKVRIEGKDYVMQDGDVVEFRFNV